MSNKKITIRALKCCIKGDCDNCPNNFGDCLTNLARCAFDLINNLQTKNKAYKHYYSECLKDLKNAHAENEKLVENIDKLKAEIKNLHTENQILSQKRFNIFERIEYSDKLKIKAYKEVLEKIRDKQFLGELDLRGVFYLVTSEDIDEIEKELVGDK